MTKEIEFGDLHWGSCQYDTAANTYHQILRNGFGDIEVTFDGLRPFKEIKAIVYDYFQEEYWDDEFWLEYKDDQEKEIEAMTTIKDCFVLLRNQAWDLWSAAPMICDWVFLNFETSEIADRTDGRGPSGNQMVQAENDRTGVYCAALHLHADVPEEAFSCGFDT
jgi:hypothetical protein